MIKAKHIGIEKKEEGVYEVIIEYGNGCKFIIPECIVTPFPDDLDNIDESEPLELTVSLKRGE